MWLLNQVRKNFVMNVGHFRQCGQSCTFVLKREKDNLFECSHPIVFYCLNK